MIDASQGTMRAIVAAVDSDFDAQLPGCIDPDAVARTARLNRPVIGRILLGQGHLY